MNKLEKNEVYLAKHFKFISFNIINFVNRKNIKTVNSNNFNCLNQVSMKKYFILFVILFLSTSFLVAQIKVACIGNSITEGYNASDHSTTSYVAQLDKLLGKKYTVRNFGSSGATACRNTYKPYASLEIFYAAMEFEPDIVIIALGTNDSQPEVWNTGNYAKNFETDLTFLCKRFEELPSKPDIYLCLPGPIQPSDRWEHQPKVLEEEIIPLINKVALNNDYTIVNYNSALKRCTDCYSDELHPNDKGHRSMAERAYVAIIKNNLKKE